VDVLEIGNEGYCEEVSGLERKSEVAEMGEIKMETGGDGCNIINGEEDDVEEIMVDDEEETLKGKEVSSNIICLENRILLVARSRHL
jgi:hypothetical protein